MSAAFYFLPRKLKPTQVLEILAAEFHYVSMARIGACFSHRPTIDHGLEKVVLEWSSKGIFKNIFKGFYNNSDNNNHHHHNKSFVMETICVPQKL